jgi:hypothetical protein
MVQTARAKIFQTSFAALFTLSLILITTSIVGFSYQVVISQDPPGTTLITHGWARRGYFLYTRVDGSRYPRNTGGAHFFPYFGVDWLSFGPLGREPHRFSLGVANWLPAAPLLFIAFWFRKRSLHARQISRGLCPICNYDLRAHRPNQKCPECGTQIPALGWRPPKP